MALTNNNLEIIKAIAKNDIHGARIAAMASLAEDTLKNYCCFCGSNNQGI